MALKPQLACQIQAAIRIGLNAVWMHELTTQNTAALDVEMFKKQTALNTTFPNQTALSLSQAERSRHFGVLFFFFVSFFFIFIFIFKVTHSFLGMKTITGTTTN